MDNYRYGFNFGLCLKQLIVIDIDVKNGKNGFVSLAKHGVTEKELLSYSMVAKTPNDGYHIYFVKPADWTYPKKCDVLEGVDLLTDQPLTCPPSMIDYKPYTWLNMDWPDAPPPWVYSLGRRPCPQPLLPIVARKEELLMLGLIELGRYAKVLQSEGLEFDVQRCIDKSGNLFTLLMKRWYCNACKRTHESNNAWGLVRQLAGFSNKFEYIVKCYMKSTMFDSAVFCVCLDLST